MDAVYLATLKAIKEKLKALINELESAIEAIESQAELETNTFVCRVQKLNRITIPADRAKQLGIKQGDFVTVTISKPKIKTEQEKPKSIIIPSDSISSIGGFKCPVCGAANIKPASKCSKCGVEFVYEE